MKQFLLLSTLTIVAGLGAIASPFWGILLYYIYAVLRPQYIWKWALPWEVRWSLIAAMIVLIGSGLHFSRIFTRATLNGVVCLMIVFVLLVLMSIITAFDPAIAQHYGIEYAKLMLMAIIASLLVTRFWQFRALSIMILLALGYIAYEINHMYVFQNYRLDVYHTGYGGLDNNGAGLMLAMGIPFAYAAICGQWKRRALVAGVGVFLAGCMAHALLLTYSRGAMLAAIIGCAWLAIRHRARWQTALGVVVAVLAITTMAGPEVRDRFESAAEYRTDASAQSRFDSWGAAWTIAWEHPVLGSGIRNSNHYTHNYGADRQGRTIHNQYLQIAADSGIPAALAYIATLGLAWLSLDRARRRAIRFLEDSDDDESTKYKEVQQAEVLCLAAQASLTIFAAGCMFLSLEVFELPWLLIVMGGVAPLVITRQIEAAEETAETEPTEDEPKTARSRSRRGPSLSETPGAATHAPGVARLGAPELHA